MCVYSMIMNEALKWPKDYWLQPAVTNIFEKMVDAAKIYDKENNQPDCELEEKKQAIKKLADGLGIKIKFLEEKEG